MKEVHSEAILSQVHSNIWTITALPLGDERALTLTVGADKVEIPVDAMIPNIKVERRAMV